MGRSAASDAIPEGTTFRLDPKLDIASLHLPRVVEMMAEAAQRYGIIVRDKTLHAIGFYAEDPSPLGTNPYTRLFDGKSPGELLAELPVDPPSGGQIEPQIQYRLRWRSRRAIPRESGHCRTPPARPGS